MATQRYISTSFWDDEWIQTLDPSEKLLYLYFMTNPLTNIAGIYKVTDRRISFDTGFNIDTIRHIIDKFETAKKAYRIEEFIILPSWPKHQKWEQHSNIKKGIDKCISELPGFIIEKLKTIDYKYPLEGFESLPEGSNYLDINTDIDTDRDRDIIHHFVSEWKNNNLPINETNFMNYVCQSEYITCFDGLTADEVSQAVKNYKYCIDRPEDYAPYTKKEPPHKFLKKMIDFTDAYEPIINKKVTKKQVTDGVDTTPKFTFEVNG